MINKQILIHIKNLFCIKRSNISDSGACLRAKSKYAGGGYGRGRPPTIR